MKHVKRFFACLVSGVILMSETSVFTQNADATTGTRTYWRHDCSSVSSTSYYSYQLGFNSNLTSSESDRTIFGSNDMVRDYDTSVVRLSCGGSGFIIDEHTIATAAHCVYSWNGHYFLDDITIDIVDTDNSVIDTISPTYFHIPYQFTTLTNTYSSTYDYALITVAEDLSDYGMFHLAVAQDSYISNLGSVIVSGFPQASAYPPGYSGSDYGLRFKAAGNLMNYISSTNIHYDADMSGGDSGGPVYVEEGKYISGTLYSYKSVIGINVSENTTYNCGVRITDDTLRFYYENDYII